MKPVNIKTSEASLAQQSGRSSIGASPYLRLDKVAKRYGSFEAVADFDLEVPRGDLVALLGPSGCGKTTTLRMIAGLITPSSGTIRVADTDVTHLPPHRRDMGLVFQSYALFPHMSVARNVAFGLDVRSVPDQEKRRQVAAALDLVQLGKLADRRPRELSGGQQQRVALARALVIQPSILLLDEPLSNLDAKLRDEMRTQIRDIQQELRITTVFVTHDQVEALSMCDSIVVMNGGHIEQIGTPYQIYEQPVSPFVASFVGRTNRIPGRRTDSNRLDFVAGAIRTATDVAETNVEAMVRPHRIAVSWINNGNGPLLPDDRNSLQAKLQRVTFVGDMIQFHFDANGVGLVAEQSSTQAHDIREPGTEATLSWAVSDTRMFGRAE